MNKKETSDPEVPDKTQRREVTIVLVAGIIGGFASWAYGLALNNSIIEGLWALPLSLFFGAFAAGVGVFVLANTDTSTFGRLVFFAALCGFSWKPVLDAGNAYVKETLIKQAQARSDSDANEQSEFVAGLAAELTNASSDVVALQFQTISTSLTDALASASTISDSKLSHQAQSNLTAAVRSLTLVASKAPNIAIPEMQKISLNANALGAKKVSLVTMTSLNTLASTNPNIAAIQKSALTTNVASLPDTFRAVVPNRFLLIR